MPDKFTTAEVAALLGVSYRAVDELMRRGLVAPAEPGPGGRGIARYWSFADVVGLRIGLEFRRRNVSWVALAKLVRYVARGGLEKVETMPYVVISGERVWAVPQTGLLDVGSLDSQAMVCDLRPGLATIKAAVETVKERRARREAIKSEARKRLREIAATN